MTVLDLMRLIQRYLKLIIIFPIIFALAAVIMSVFSQVSYTATASFITSGDLAFAQGLASSEAIAYANNGIQISCSSQSATKQVVVSATGPDSRLCVESANAVAESAVDQYKSANSSVVSTVSEATSAARNSPSLIKVAIAGVILGFFVAICVVVLIDIAKAPIKSREEAESVSDLPVLGMPTSEEGGDRILANLEFCCGRRPSTVAIVPIGEAQSAIIVSSELVSALERSNVRAKLVKGSPHARRFRVSVPEDAAAVVCCPPLTAGAGATYIANRADATVLCVVEWTDSERQLAATVRELQLAKANLAGLALLPEANDLREKKSVRSKKNK